MQNLPLSYDPGNGLVGFIVNDSTPIEIVQRLASDPRVELDIMDMTDLRRLPREMKASLHSNAETVEAQFKSVGNMTFPVAKTIVLPNLEKAGTIHAFEVMGFQVSPRLKYDTANSFTLSEPSAMPIRPFTGPDYGAALRSEI